MTLTDLYRFADTKSIYIYSIELEDNISISIPSKNKYYIAIDVDKIETNIEEKECLAHELGHCETGSFYNIYSKLDIRAKHENRADKWAIKKLIPQDELKEAINCGYIELWELAEYFEVTYELMEKAII